MEEFAVLVLENSFITFQCYWIMVRICQDIVYHKLNTHPFLTCVGLMVNCLNSQSTRHCIDLPGINPNVNDLSFVWPRVSTLSDGYCKCSLHSPRFVQCVSSCGSLYQVSYLGSEMCLSDISRLRQRNEELKVYFVTTETGPSDDIYLYSIYGYSVNGKCK